MPSLPPLEHMSTDDLWDMIVALARTYSQRKYRETATGITLQLRSGQHVEPFPMIDLVRLAAVVPDRKPPAARPVEHETPAPSMNGSAGGWASGPAPKHLSNFAAVYWPGLGTFHFSGPKQQEVAQFLWEAWEEGAPHVTQVELTRATGSTNDRLHHLFRPHGKDHPAWGVLILKGILPGTFTFPSAPKPSGEDSADDSYNDGYQRSDVENDV